jgi:hypothetical protein
MLSEPDRDMEKLGGDHKTRRTAAFPSSKTINRRARCCNGIESVIT